MTDPTLQKELAELHNEAGGGGQAGGGARNETGGDGERGPDYDGGQLAGGYYVIREIADQADVLGEPWALRPEEKHALAHKLGKIADRHMPDDSAEIPPWADYVFAAVTVIAIAAPRYAALQQMKEQEEAEAEREARRRQRPETPEETETAEGEGDGADT